MNQATGSAYAPSSSQGKRAKTSASLIAEYAAGSAVLAAALTAIGTFKESGGAAGEYLVVVGIILATTAVVFGLLARMALRDRSEGNTPALAALILGILGAVSIAVFWTGLPAVFAGGAALLALEARRAQGEARKAQGETRNRGVATSALVLCGVTVVLAVVAAIFG